MRRPTYLHGRSGPLGLQMTPLIDVVFLLLIFFVWTSSFQPVEYSLPSSLFAASGGGATSPIDPELVDLERVVIRIGWHDNRPTWSINQRRLGGLTELRATLTELANIQAAVPLVLDATPDVPLGHVIDVYDIARQEGFARVQFTADVMPN